MKQCSLNHFTESLNPWLNSNYIKSITLSKEHRVTFSFNDGVNDTYEITDCSNKQIDKVCRHLAASGISVRGLE